MIFGGCQFQFCGFFLCIYFFQRGIVGLTQCRDGVLALGCHHIKFDAAGTPARFQQIAVGQRQGQYSIKVLLLQLAKLLRTGR